MVQPLVTSWYSIPGFQDKRLECSVLGCVMNAALTDGKRAICVQHATEHAMHYTISLRVNHDEAGHHPDGHCINCGQCMWSHNRIMRVYQCIPCNNQGIMTAKNMVNPKDFAAIPGSLSLEKLPRVRSMPKDATEKARTAKWVDDYLKWRLSGTK